MEDINSVLGVKSEEAPKQESTLKNDESPKQEKSVLDQEPIDLSVGDNSAESVLSYVSYTILILGLLVSCIMGYYVGHEGKTKDGWNLFLFMSFFCVVTWAISMLLVNISNNLRTIKHLLARGRTMADDLS